MERRKDPPHPGRILHEKMKNLKKLLSFLTILCLLAGSATEVSASGTRVPHIKFTNESNESYDLRVTKKITPVPSDAEIPEHAKFSFVLKLDKDGDGKVESLASETKYTLSDRDGEIIRKDGFGHVLEFMTDKNGVFELENGQTATFKNVGEVFYEVTESKDYSRPEEALSTSKPEDVHNGFQIDKSAGYSYYRRTVRKYKENNEDKEEIKDTQLRPEYMYQKRGMAKDGYELISPIGGSSGTVTLNMGTIVFENRYTPDDVSTVLRVKKTVSYPDGYELPEEVKDTTFWFHLEISDNGGREYTVENPVNQEVPTVRLTDANGDFYLYPGETAVFANVNGEEGYRVEEKLPPKPDENTGAATTDTKVCPSDWWPTGSAVREGDKIPVSAVTFNNANTSFIVRKTMDDITDSAGVEFTFQLVDAQNNPMPGVTYYRYDILGKNLITQEGTGQSGSNQKWTTEENTGYFKLRPGEEALFCGIKPDTSYTVREIGRLIVDQTTGEVKVDPSYAEQPPQSGEVSGTGQVTTRNFVNSRVDVTGTLTVTKHVENTGSEGSMTQDEDKFYFRLYKRMRTTSEVKRELIRLGRGKDDLKKELVAEILDADKKVSGIEEPAKQEKFSDEEFNTAVRGASSNALKGCIGKVLEENYGWKLVAPSSEVTESEDNWYYESDGKKEIYACLNGEEFEVVISRDVVLKYATGDSGDPGDVWGTGEFALKAGQTARFSGLLEGGQYRVEEVRFTSEYKPKPAAAEKFTSNAGALTDTQVIGGVEQIVARDTNGTYEYIQTAVMPQEGLALTFTNLYTPKKTDIEIVKVGDRGEPLAGAEFMLYLNKGKEDKVLPEYVKELPEKQQETFRYTTVLEDIEVKDPDATQINQDPNDSTQTPKRAVVRIPDLKPGTYWLYEEKAPSGYRLLPEPIEIRIIQTKDGLKATIDGIEYTPGDSATVNTDTLKEVTVTSGSGQPDNTGKVPNDQIQLTIPNLYFYELPSSGGMGIYWYSIGGMLLMMAASLILYRNKHRGEVLKD